MQKRKNYIGKGNTELDPKKNVSDRILYEFDDVQYNTYSSIKNDLSGKFTKNILLGGARGCGKSSLVNLAIEPENNLVVKIDCSIADEEEDLLTLIVSELKKILDSARRSLGGELYKEINRLIKEITFSITNIHKITELESTQEEGVVIANFIEEFLLSLKIINSKSGIQAKLKEAMVSKRDKTEEILQQRVTTYVERKAAFELLIDKINEMSGKKLVFIFDEIDKQNIDFLDKVFDKYKTFLTSGKSTNIFLVSVSQYYHLVCGNACESIEIYFDKKYFLRAVSFSKFKNICYNEICSNVDLEISYYLSQGIFRKMYADIDIKTRNIILLFKAKYFIELVEFVNSCDELEDFVKEILVSVLNKVLKRGLVGNRLCLNSLQEICSEEFSDFRGIQLEKLTLYSLKSHMMSSCDKLITMNEDELIVDYNKFEKKYEKLLFRNSNAENSSSYLENREKKTERVEGEKIYSKDNNFININGGQIELRNYEYFEFQLIDDGEGSHRDIIKTLLYDTVVKAFITVKKKNYLGYAFGYVLFVDSSLKGRYVLYYDDASWSYGDHWVKNKIDNFILENNIKEIEIEVDSDFKANKNNLYVIVDKFNQHEKVTKDWFGVRW